MQWYPSYFTHSSYNPKNSMYKASLRKQHFHSERWALNKFSLFHSTICHVLCRWMRIHLWKGYYTLVKNANDRCRMDVLSCLVLSFHFGVGFVFLDKCTFTSCQRPWNVKFIVFLCIWKTSGIWRSAETTQILRHLSRLIPFA